MYFLGITEEGKKSFQTPEINSKLLPLLKQTYIIPSNKILLKYSVNKDNQYIVTVTLRKTEPEQGTNIAH